VKNTIIPPRFKEEKLKFRNAKKASKQPVSSDVSVTLVRFVSPDRKKKDTHPVV